ncbi:Dynein heavy chain domain-1 [Trinorchestia longiramus]|nr:Dynein heavy chain domain-1 [Trinorchestia longiramus]
MKGLKDIIKSWQEMCAEVSQKTYDYLNYRDPQFDQDLEVFGSSVKELLRRVHTMVEKEHEEVWDTPMALRMLHRFEKIAEVVPNLDVEGKHKKILSCFHQEIDRVTKAYNKYCDNPLPLLGLPQVAEDATLVLTSQIAEVQKSLRCSLIVQHPQTQDLYVNWDPRIPALLREASSIQEMGFQIAEVQKSLRCSLIVQHPQTQDLYVNWDPRIPALLREASSIQEMGFQVPYAVSILLSRASSLYRRRDMTRHILLEYEEVRKKACDAVRPLLVPHASLLREALQPGLTSLTWSSVAAEAFLEDMIEEIKAFETLVDRVNDIFLHRMEGTLAQMTSVSLLTLPSDQPWSLDTLVNTAYKTACWAARDLNDLSHVIEDAVFDMITLVMNEMEKVGGGSAPAGGLSSYLSFEDLDEGKNFDDSKSVTSLGSSRRSRSNSPQFNRNGDEGLGAPGSNLPRPLSTKEKQQKKFHELREKVSDAAKEIRRSYHRRVLEVIIRSVRSALDMLRNYAQPPVPSTKSKKGGSFVFSEDVYDDLSTKRGRRGVALVKLVAFILAPGIEVTPKLEEVNEALVKVAKSILSVAKGIARIHDIFQKAKGAAAAAESERLAQAAKRDWRERERLQEVMPVPSNYYNSVCESKEVLKVMNQFTSGLANLQQELENTFSAWEVYHDLWRMDRDSTIRDLLASSPSLADYDAVIESYVLMGENIKKEPDVYSVGAMDITTDRLKSYLIEEAELWVSRYAKAIKCYYMKESERLFALLSELSRRLEKPLEDLDDIKGAIDILRRTRDLELDMDDSIDPIEASA